MRGFVILAQARTASTNLRMVLHQHPDLVCHGEVLAIHRVLGFERPYPFDWDSEDYPERELRIYRNLDPAAFLEKHVLTGENAGFKLLDSQAAQVHNRQVVNKMRADGVKVILLDRKDSLDREISEHILTSRQNQKPPYDINWDDIKLSLIESDVRWRLIVRKFKNNPTLSLSYEDMIEDFQTTINNVCDFLGVSNIAAGFVTTKSSAAPTRERVKNYTDLEKKYARLSELMEI